MKNAKLILSVAVTVSALLGIGVASAADLAVKAMPYAAPAPVFSWTGCYVGVHAGGGTIHNGGTGGIIEVVQSDGAGALASGERSGNGGLAGGQLGCNYQGGNWVFGAEGEGYWSGIKATNTSLDSEGLGNIDTAKNKYDFSIAARAGIAFDRTLVYGKAGWVWGQFDFLSTDNCCSLSNPSLITHAANDTLNGLLLGVGIEHALTNNWTVKLEYNYLKYGSKELSVTECNSNSNPRCFADGTQSFNADKQIFKIGANYLFNMTVPPLVAKY